MSGPFFKVALVSMPWPVFNRPSIQLGALKAYLETDRAISATSFYPYLEVSKRLGSETYNQISLRSWTSEALYSALLFPEKKKDCEKLIIKESAGSGRME